MDCICVHGRKDGMGNRMKKLKDYTDEQKIEWFDKMFNWAKTMLDAHLKRKRIKDYEHYTWEDVMDLLGDGVWDEWRSVDY